MQMNSSLPAGFRALVSRIYRRLNVLERAEKCCLGVTLAQCMTLELLREAAPMSASDLAGELGVDSSTSTRLIDVLERDGLVTRQRDDRKDRRRVYLALSDRGVALADSLRACSESYCRTIVERLPANRREQVLDSLRLLAAAIEEKPSTCC